MHETRGCGETKGGTHGGLVAAEVVVVSTVCSAHNSTCCNGDCCRNRHCRGEVTVVEAGTVVEADTLEVAADEVTGTLVVAGTVVVMGK